MIHATITDLKRKEIDTEPILFGLGFVALALLAQTYDLDVYDALLGFVIGGGIFVSLAFFGMGGGDIKLMAMIGAFMGWYKTLLIIQLSFFVGAIVSICFLVFRKRGLKDSIAFGPSIAVATGFIALWGDWIIARFFTFTF